jgi:flagellar basal-body rod protein FlgG
MLRSLSIAATGMSAAEAKLDTIANNLANSNTVGFKRQDVQFEDLLYQNVRTPAEDNTGATPPVGVQAGSGARVVSTPRSFTQGAINQTGNPLDLAIEGSGFLPVTLPTGDIAYTRAGSLQLDATGRLVTTDGYPMDPPINIPADTTAVAIAADGTVTVTEPKSTTPNKVGQLQLVMFPNPPGLNATGHNLYAATASSGEPTTGLSGIDGRGTFLQGSTESSNVDVVTEMVNMISTQRAYELNSKVISTADEMLRDATQLKS